MIFPCLHYAAARVDAGDREAQPHPQIRAAASVNLFMRDIYKLKSNVKPFDPSVQTPMVDDSIEVIIHSYNLAAN